MTNKLIENIRLLRKRKGWGQSDMAERLGLQLNTYGKIERGMINLNVDRLFELAKLLDTTTEFLLHGTKTEQTDTTNITSQNTKKGNVTYVPVYAQAGTLAEVEQSTISEKLYIPNISGSNLFMIHVEGDSMMPTLSNGDLIILKKQDTPTIQWGHVYVVDTLDGMAVKRIFQHKGSDKYSLVSDNEFYPPYEVSLSDIRAIWQVKGFISKNLSPKSVKNINSLN